MDIGRVGVDYFSSGEGQRPIHHFENLPKQLGPPKWLMQDLANAASRSYCVKRLLFAIGQKQCSHSWGDLVQLSHQLRHVDSGCRRVNDRELHGVTAVTEILQRFGAAGSCQNREARLCQGSGDRFQNGFPIIGDYYCGIV